MRNIPIWRSRAPSRSEGSADEAPPADDGGGEGHEGFVDVVADLPADAQAAEPVQQRDRLLDHPPMHAEAGAVRGAPAGDDRFTPLAQTIRRYLSWS